MREHLAEIERQRDREIERQRNTKTESACEGYTRSEAAAEAAVVRWQASPSVERPCHSGGIPSAVPDHVRENKIF